MDKDDLIIAQMEDEEDWEIDELHEAEVEELKIRDYDNLVLLGNLLKEVTAQINHKTPNLIKIKEMING